MDDPTGNKDDISSRFLRLLLALRFRTTSRREDESLCIAPIINLERKDLLNTDDSNESIKIFLSMWEQIPTYFAFLDGSRIQDLGYRWMPTSFLEGNHKSFILRAPLKWTTFDNQGIYIKHPGLLITCSEIENIYFKLGFNSPIDSRWYGVRDTGAFENSLPEKQRWSYWRRRIHLLERPAFILEYPSHKFEDYIIAVLVNISRVVDGTIFASHLCRIWLMPLHTDRRFTTKASADFKIWLGEEYSRELDNMSDKERMELAFLHLRI